MLELLGVEYINVLVLTYKADTEKHDYIAAFIGDSINLIPQNKYRTDTLKDVLFADPEYKRSDRSGDEIAADIIKKYGLKVDESA